MSIGWVLHFNKLHINMGGLWQETPWHFSLPPPTHTCSKNNYTFSLKTSKVSHFYLIATLHRFLWNTEKYCSNWIQKLWLDSCSFRLPTTSLRESTAVVTPFVLAHRWSGGGRQAAPVNVHSWTYAATPEPQRDIWHATSNPHPYQFLFGF